MKYFLQLEERGEFVEQRDTLEEIKQAAVERNFPNLRWLDRPTGGKQSFAVLFKDEPGLQPFAVAYPKKDKPMFIWRDPSAE